MMADSQMLGKIIKPPVVGLFEENYSPSALFLILLSRTRRDGVRVSYSALIVACRDDG